MGVLDAAVSKPPQRFDSKFNDDNHARSYLPVTGGRSAPASQPRGHAVAAAAHVPAQAGVLQISH